MTYCKYNTNFLIAVIFVLFANIQTKASPGKYPIRNFTPTDYKAGIQNIDFAQNRGKNIFVANNLGVLSFNGNDWESHTLNTGKKKRSLAFDEENNRLYVGSQGEFGYFNEDWEYISLVSKVPLGSRDFDEVWDVFIYNSNIYFCTFDGIYLFNGREISVLKHKDKFNRSFQTQDGLFTQSANGELLKILDHELVPIGSNNARNEIVSGIITQGEGYILFYNSGRIEFSTPFSQSEKYRQLANYLEGSYVNHVLQLSDSRLAISTQTSGLFLYDEQKNSVENITAMDGLQTSACLRSFQDYAGNLWIGMQNGIALVNINSPVRLINQEIDLQGSGYDAYETIDGTYFTTSNGIYYLAKNVKQCVFLEGTEGPAYSIQSIAGKLYAGHHTGLFYLKDGSASRITTTVGLWQVKQLRSNPEFVIGGTYSGLFLFKLNKDLLLEPIKYITGFAETSRFFEEDDKGRIWVGQFYKGLYQITLSLDLRSAQVTKVSDQYDLPIKEQIILSKIDNDLYIGTQKGIYLLDQNTDQIIKADIFEEVVGDEQVNLLVQDHNRNIHILTENLVGFFNQIGPRNYFFVRSSLYQLRYTFNNDLLNLSINHSNGVLYNANEGFISYDPSQENRVAFEAPLVVSKVYSVTQDSTLYIQKPFENIDTHQIELVISQKTKVLKFHVESFQYGIVNNHQFRYFLKGFNETFDDWTESTTKEYTNLKEGQYEFSVSTKDFLGEIKEIKSVIITVKPPVHKSLLAKIFYFCILVLSLVYISGRQKRAYKVKAKEIEDSKRQELEEKQQRIFEIQKEKEQELIRLEEEKIKSELNHLNNLLAASTMNLVVKNEFLENIRKELNEVKKKGKYSDTKQALEKIVKDIEITLRLQDDWEQFEYHFDKVHGDFSSRLRKEFQDLTPNEQKLSAFLRLNLNSKEISNLMGVSLRGVEVARYRLRKKLKLDKGQNLSKFILEY